MVNFPLMPELPYRRRVPDARWLTANPTLALTSLGAVFFVPRRATGVRTSGKQDR